MIILNGKEIRPTIFPDKTSQVWHLDLKNEGSNIVWWWFENEAELFHLLQLNDLLCRESMGTLSFLNIPYLPYARQDKNCANNESFALEPFSDVMNLMYWQRIKFFDVHSDKATLLLDSSQNIEPDLSFVKDYDVVCLPDKGAYDRYLHLVEPHNKCVIFGEKVRDPETGWITEYEIKNLDSVRQLMREGKTNVYREARVIVVDDLCDGGATFNILAKSLWSSIKPDLYVSHGLFSKGVNKLLENYGKIITTDSCFKNIHMNNAARQSVLWRERLDAKVKGRIIIHDVEELMHVQS